MIPCSHLSKLQKIYMLLMVYWIDFVDTKTTKNKQEINLNYGKLEMVKCWPRCPSTDACYSIGFSKRFYCPADGDKHLTPLTVKYCEK